MFFRFFSGFFSKSPRPPLRKAASPGVLRGVGPSLKGLIDMGIASVLFAVMAACVFQLTRLTTPVDAVMASFIRVLVTFVILLIPSLFRGRVALLWGDLQGALWLRGLFGGSSLLLSFLAIQRIGPGESAFLTATSGFFVVLLAPWILGEPSRRGDWLSILGGLLGLFLLLVPEGEAAGDLAGRLIGLGSGFLAALAYLMVSRAGRRNDPRTIVFYFSLVAVLLHLIWFGVFGVNWPRTPEALGLCLGAGLLGTLAQMRLTRAYQRAPAAKVSAVGYLSPVLSLLLGLWLFDQRPGPWDGLGCLLILMTGVALPMGRARFNREHESPRSRRD